MNTTVTPPPPAPPAPTPSPAPQTPPRGSGPGKPVAIILIVIGALILLGSIFGAIRATVLDATRITDTQVADVSGVTSLDMEASASMVRIEFGDVEEATLEITDAHSEWVLSRNGEELSVSTRDELFDGWGRWGRWGWDWDGEDEEVVLTLPQSLEGLDARLSLAAGDVRADGSFGELELDLGAGGMDVRGSAESLTADVSAGTVRVELADVNEASVTVSAGRLHGELTGEAPSSLDVSVSAGSLDLTLPEGEYDVTQDVSAGAFDNRLETSSASENRVMVDVSAGHVMLRSAR